MVYPSKILVGNVDSLMAKSGQNLGCGVEYEMPLWCGKLFACLSCLVALDRNRNNIITYLLSCFYFCWVIWQRDNFTFSSMPWAYDIINSCWYRIIVRTFRLWRRPIKLFVNLIIWFEVGLWQRTKVPRTLGARVVVTSLCNVPCCLIILLPYIRVGGMGSSISIRLVLGYVRPLLLVRD